MTVYIRTPYSLTKNIGEQYNKEFASCPDEDALCFIDGDMMFLTPDFGHILNDYANLYPNDVLTCWTNRTHSLSKEQQHQCTTYDVKECIEAAMRIKDDRTVTEVTGIMSMLLQVIPKSVWLKHPFIEYNQYRPDETNMLGVDSEWSNRIRKNGVRVLRMNGFLMYHQYRLLTNSKEHLL